ncbi:MAG: Hsp70 family protein, partial [Selenomonas sp.]|nr:Hsp70 family protein [Selenomonas sp.]
SLAYQAEKTLKDLGDKADKAQAASVQAGIDKLKEALKGGDTDAIKKATEELQKPLYEMSAAAYQQAQAAGAQGAPGADAGAGAQQQAKADDDVVDAEYTEVKDDKK